MRFSARSKVGILLSLVTILTLISAFAVTTFMGGRGTQAAHASHSLTYHGHRVSATKQKLHVTKAVKHSLKSHAVTKSHAIPGHFGKASSARLNTAKQNAPRLSAANAAALLGPRVNEGGILHNFRGLTAEQSGFLSGVLVHPPDQALCVGHDGSIAGNPKVVFEVINLAIAEYDTSGNILTSDLLPFGPDNMNDFFGEPGIPFFGGELVSDPNCIFDAASNSFYFEAIATDLFVNGPFFTESHTDLVVYNASTGDAAEYVFGTSDNGNTGCPCLGDQGKLGIDNNAVYISMDEFQSDLLTENGAELFAIHKSEVAAQTTPAFASQFINIVDPVSGVPITSLQPAVSVSPSNVEYLVNSLPFLDNQQLVINPTSKTLGFWTVTNDEDIPNTDVTLTGIDIASERYAFNVPAKSTGDGSFNPITFQGFASFVQADDDRMMQAEFIGGNVWASLDSAVNIAGDPVTRDGVAWFKIGVHSQTVRQQGFIGSPRNNLLFPSIQVTAEGTVGIAFSITGPTLNPTAAYIVRKAGATSFGSIVRAFTGLSPAFTIDAQPGPPFFGRWGDYSRATLDPNGKNIWMATEYAEALDQFEFAVANNDATRVWDVKGDS